MKQSKSSKSMSANKSQLGGVQDSRYENSAKERMDATSRERGSVDKGGVSRTMGAATKDAKHGLHTDHSASRRSESRRAGSMGSESKAKSNRKNI